MIQGIGAIGGKENVYNDPEYRKIIQELFKLGLAPTGNKNADKARLETEKQKIAQKIIQKAQEQQPTHSNDNVQRAQMEEQKLGAMNVAELNKLLHGIKNV